MVDGRLEPFEIPLTQPAIEVVVEESAETQPGEDGGVEIVFGATTTPEPPAFGANLADHLPEEEVRKLCIDLLADFEADALSRKDWEETYIKGYDLLGVKPEEKNDPWPKACGVYHPVLMEAVVRFQSQAISEIFPASGPCRVTIVGEQDDARIRQAARVQEDINYELTERMSEYRDETERLLFSLPLAGSAFRKVYYDPTWGRQAAVFVPAEDLVVSYGCTSLENAPRCTQIIKISKGDMTRYQESGFYRKVDLLDPVPEISRTDDKKDTLIGVTPNYQNFDYYRILEMHVDLQLSSDSNELRPYVVAMESSTQTILSIRRNWRENDDLHRKRQHFIHYKYIPGPGFYGFGLIHLIGGATRSATSILRQLVDAGTLSNLPGGFKSRGLRVKVDDNPIMPGEWRDVDVPAGTIKDCLLPIPAKEPSVVLYQLLQNIVDEARRVASVADMEVGDMNQTAPVGTTLALLERAMKVMSAVQARLHASLRQELRLLVELIKEYASEAYDYDVAGADRTIKRQDYDDRVDVIPVSDPNAASMAQRILQYQSALQLAAQAPQLYDMVTLHRQMLTVLGIQNVDAILPNKEDIAPADPVTENMAILNGKPVKAFQYQPHEAHIECHMAAMQDPRLVQMVAMSPMAASIQQQSMAHIFEHLAWAYRDKIEQAMGVPLPAAGIPIPPEIEDALAHAVATAGRKVLEQGMAEAAAKKNQEAAQDPVLQQQMAETQIKAMKVQQDAASDQAKIQQQQQKLQQDAAQAAQRFQIERERIASQERIANASLQEKAHSSAQTNRIKASEALLRNVKPQGPQEVKKP